MEQARGASAWSKSLVLRWRVYILLTLSRLLIVVTPLEIPRSIFGQRIIGVFNGVKDLLPKRTGINYKDTELDLSLQELRRY